MVDRRIDNWQDIERQVRASRQSLSPEELAAKSTEAIAAVSHIQKFSANEAKNAAIQEISLRHSLVREIVTHHSSYPFQSLQLECTRSAEAKAFYLDILKAIEFGQTLKDVVQELVKVGEIILLFEGQWGPPKFLNPNEIEVWIEPGEDGQPQEDIHYKVPQEIKEMVLSTPVTERESLLKIMDAYSIRQIQLGRSLNLTKSPYIKIIHTRRVTTDRPNAIRGVSYFDPVLDRLITAEGLKDGLIKGTEIDYSKAIRKIRETDKLLFEFAFPRDLSFLEGQMRYLQDLVKHFLIEEIFKPAALRRNYFDSQGLILPELDFMHLDLQNDGHLRSYIEELREKSGIDTQTTSLEEYMAMLRDQQ